MPRRMIVRNLNAKCMILMTCVFHMSCGRRSSSEDSGGGAATGSFAGSRVDVTGSIISQTGSQSQMQGWATALVERDSGIARVAEADSSGILKFSKASLEAAQTLVLLSPDYLVQSVLSIPSTKTNTIKQYFQMTKNTIPRLIQKGGIITFQNVDTLTVQDNTATDTNADGVPDGVASLGLSYENHGFKLVSTDTDKDGLTNDLDTDIDGDGLINVIDTDDDGDGIADYVDADANGDSVTDSQQQVSEQYFKAGLEYVAVQYTVTPTTKTLKFVTKVRDGVTPKAVAVKGATSFLKDSTYTSSDGTTGAWDYSLVDDGKSEDSGEKDLTYGRLVTLATGITPRNNQVVFFQLTMGEGTEKFVAEYPYMFPNVTPATPTTSYDTTTRTVTLAGDPFGASVQDFVWTVSVKNSDGTKVYESGATPGATRTLVIPANILMSGKTYTYKAVAQLLDKVSGVPAMAVHSADGTITN